MSIWAISRVMVKRSIKALTFKGKKLFLLFYIHECDHYTLL